MLRFQALGLINLETLWKISLFIKYKEAIEDNSDQLKLEVKILKKMKNQDLLHIILKLLMVKSKYLLPLNLKYKGNLLKIKRMLLLLVPIISYITISLPELSKRKRRILIWLLRNRDLEWDRPVSKKNPKLMTITKMMIL